ncbi:putative multidrug-efflux transporter/MT1670 [Roseibium album]|nr:putative multidrug-efflux transporter/MT1670 [Roseibium album]
MSLSASLDAASITSAEDSSLSLFTKERAPVTLALALGVGSHAVNRFVTVAVLPDIIRDLGGQDQAFWLFAAFEMAAILSGFLTGAAKMRYGAKAPFLIATLVLAAGSVIAGFSPVFWGLIVGKTLQGFGEGVVIAICYALIPDVYPRRVAARVFAVLSGIWAIAAAVGPVSAGLMTDLWSWRAAFLVNIPLTILLGTLIFVSIPGWSTSRHQQDQRQKERKKHSLFTRLTLLILCVLCLTAIGEVREPLMLFVTIGAGLFTAVLFLKADRSGGARLLPLEAFRPQTLIGLGTWIVLMISVTAAVRAIFVATFGQVLWGLSVTEASYVAALLAMSWTVFAWISARAKNRTAEMVFMISGPILIVLGLALAGLAVDTKSLWLFMTASIVNGAGHGVSSQIMTRSLMYGSKESERDLVSAMLPSLSSAGAAVGGGLTGLLAIQIGLISPANDGLVTYQAIENAGAILFYIMAAITLIPAAAMFVLRTRILRQEGVILTRTP